MDQSLSADTLAPDPLHDAGKASIHTTGLRVWVDDAASFSTHRVQTIQHDFHLHPLMQLPELAKLAKELAVTGQCRFIKPDTEQGSPFNHESEDPEGRAIEEVFRRIDEPGSWVALYNVQSHPAYRGFLAEVTASVRSLVDPQQPGMFLVDGFIFISAPPSVTPFHIDRENNFWLQMKGRKTMNVWDHTDRQVVSAGAVDGFVVHGDLEKVRLQDGMRARSHEFDVGPGDGVYFPSTSPHMTRSDAGWVRPGDGVSISVGVVFCTRHTRRSANIHVFNQFLRGRGLSPREPGLSVWLDRLKYPCARALVWARKTFRGYEPRAGM